MPNTLYGFTLESVRPLLMDRIDPRSLLEVRDKKPRMPKQKDMTEEEEASNKLYREGNDPTGRIGIPSENLFSCLVHAGRLVKLEGKKQMSTADASLIPSFLFLEETFFPFEGDPKWVIDMRPGRNATGQLLCIVRPRFDHWKLSGTMQLDLEAVTIGKIEELLHKAGKCMGLGGFRPETRGQYGMFKLVELACLDSEAAA